MRDESPSTVERRSLSAPAAARHPDAFTPRSAAALHQLAIAALDSTLEGLVILDEDWRLVFLNAAAERFIRKPRAELIGQDLRVVFPDARDRRFGVECRRARAENVPVSFEEFYPEPLNAWFEVRAYPSTEGLSILFRDVSARRRTEEELRESEQRYRSLFTSMTEGFAVLESVVDDHGAPCDSRFLEVNPAFERLTGLKRDDVLGRLSSEVFPADHARWVTTYGAVASTGESITVDHYSPTIGRHYAVLAYRPAPRQFAILFHDITDRKRAEEKVADAHREEVAARQKLEARVVQRTTDLAQRTAQLQTLARDLTKAEELERRKVAEVIHDQLQQVLSVAKIKLDTARGPIADGAILNDLSDVADLIAESLDITRSLTAELRPAILHRSGLANTLRWLGRWYEERVGLRVEVEAEEDPDADEESRVTLFRSVRELLFNVVKHAGVTSARIRLGRTADGRVCIVVSDEGAGFNPETLQTRDRTEGGFGLLSLRERLDLLGGRLEVESAPGRGSRFTIIGPVPQPAGPAIPAGSPAAPSPTAAKRRPDSRSRPARKKASR